MHDAPYLLESAALQFPGTPAVRQRPSLMPAPLLSRILPAAALLLTTLVAGPLRAESTAPAPTFTESLAPADQDSLALTKLSGAEKSALDRLVARDVAAARQGGVTGFRGTFSSRRTAGERAQAGLEKLSAPELAQLDERVARAIATRPLVTPLPRQADTTGIDVSTALKPEIHGRVTLGYGWGGGGSYRFGSVETSYYDPESRTTLSIGLGTVSGRSRNCFNY